MKLESSAFSIWPNAPPVAKVACFITSSTSEIIISSRPSSIARVLKRLLIGAELFIRRTPPAITASGLLAITSPALLILAALMLRLIVEVISTGKDSMLTSGCASSINFRAIVAAKVLDALITRSGLRLPIDSLAFSYISGRVTGSNTLYGLSIPWALSALV